MSNESEIKTNGNSIINKNISFLNFVKKKSESTITLPRAIRVTEEEAFPENIQGSGKKQNKLTKLGFKYCF